MQSKLGHVYLYVPDLDRTYSFYKNLLEYLDYRELIKQDWGFAFINDDTSIWFEQTPKEYQKDGYHRKRTGLNHLAFRVNSKEEVDKFHKEYLDLNNIPLLYETPKPFPEYGEDYYAVYFEDPDRIKIEVAYYP